MLLPFLMISGCARPALSGPQADAAREAAGETTDYRLGIGDRVRVIVYNEQSLSGEFAVSAAGSLSFPLIGDIAATSKTASQVASEIQAKLANGYLRDPKVSMEVITYRPYFILGEVKTPGQYPYANGLTITNAIATAAGYTPRADKKVVFIRRSGEAQERAYRITPDLRVFPGDTVRLAERFF
jgi:polysaccharide export outer membrane protein